MSIPRITGQQARELLESIARARAGDSMSDLADLMDLDDEIRDLAIPLAETVAWLYERIAEIHNDQRCWADAYRAPHLTDPDGTDPARLARAEAHDDCADMLQTLLDDEEARP